MAGFKWSAAPDKVWPAGAEAYARAVRAGVHGVALKWSAILTNELKQNAPWSDKTGNARQGLYSAVEPPTPAQVTGLIELIISHGAAVDYSIFLELANAGRFAIIGPTLDAAAPRVWADIRSLFV